MTKYRTSIKWCLPSLNFYKLLSIFYEIFPFKFFIHCFLLLLFYYLPGAQPTRQPPGKVSLGIDCTPPSFRALAPYPILVPPLKV